jgi:hypothetical protein
MAQEPRRQSSSNSDILIFYCKFKKNINQQIFYASHAYAKDYINKKCHYQSLKLMAVDTKSEEIGKTLYSVQFGVNYYLSFAAHYMTCSMTCSHVNATDKMLCRCNKKTMSA